MASPRVADEDIKPGQNPLVRRIPVPRAVAWLIARASHGRRSVTFGYRFGGRVPCGLCQFPREFRDMLIMAPKEVGVRPFCEARARRWGQVGGRANGRYPKGSAPNRDVETRTRRKLCRFP